MKSKWLVRPLALAAAILLPALLLGTGASAQSTPTGQVTLGQSTLEPAIDDVSGGLVFLLTPNHAPFPTKANPIATAPLYVVVYPTSSSVGTLNCMHMPADNCPDHGPGIAAAAAKIEPAVYGSGVLGHDHLVAPPA